MRTSNYTTFGSDLTSGTHDVTSGARGKARENRMWDGPTKSHHTMISQPSPYTTYVAVRIYWTMFLLPQWVWKETFWKKLRRGVYFPIQFDEMSRMNGHKWGQISLTKKFITHTVVRIFYTMYVTFGETTKKNQKLFAKNQQNVYIFWFNLIR